MKNHPHDEFFRYLFSLLDVARAFLNAFLPAGLLSCLDLDTLAPDETAHITPELAAVYSDKVFTCRLKNLPGQPAKTLVATIAVLLEHKSSAPKFPHFQLNEYRQRIWMSSSQGRQKPSVVLPIILYHGKQRWNKKGLAEYFGAVPAVLKPFIGDFDYVLVDLSHYTDEELLRLKISFLAYGMLTMKHAQDKKWLEEKFRIIFEKGEEFLKTAEGQNFVEYLFVYYAQCSEISDVELKSRVVHNFSKSMQSTTLSTYEQIILRGKMEGKIEGKIEGRIEGKIEGKIEQSLFVARKLLLKMPHLTDEQIADLSGSETSAVREIRASLSSRKTSSKNKNGEN